MPKRVPYGFCGLKREIVFVGDIVRNRFGLDNPYYVLEIYKCGYSYYFRIWRESKGQIWLCGNDVEYVCHGYEYESLLTD